MRLHRRVIKLSNSNFIHVTCNEKQVDPETASSVKTAVNLLAPIQATCMTNTAIFGQIDADVLVLVRRENYSYLATSTCPLVFLYPVST